jgi:MoxR-like ATPase
MCLSSRMEFATAARDILTNIETVIDGKPEAAEAALVVLLAEGHLLIEDVPGVGKTVLAKALGRSISCSVRRIQFTPDLLPSDITGVSVYNQVDREFEFKPGAVFANIVIGDEINRASPKTQSALLEAMEERQVTVDGTTYVLASPFTVVATQNPFEMEGTYALPEAQRDRFMARISMGYPDAEAELAMVRGRDADNPFDGLEAVASIEDVQAMIATARAVYVSPGVERYAVDIAQATRNDPELRLGASPRATLQLLRAAKARAAIQGRDFVLPDDVDALVPVVLPHRLIPMRGVSSTQAVVDRIVAETPVPAGAVQPG